VALVRRELTEWPDLVRRFFDADWDAGWLRVEEYRDGDEVVVRAELPGIDPDKDVELSMSDGVLHIAAHREEKSEKKGKDGYHSEFRYGSFTRTVALPAGLDETSVKATYTDGVLEVRVPVGPEPKETITRIPVTKS
jgi:HSP20 family protein